MHIFTWSWTTFCHRVHFGRARWRWNREDTGEFQLGFFWQKSSVGWVYIVFLEYAHFHMELNYFCHRVYVEIVKIRVSFNWGSFGEIHRIGKVYIAFLVYTHFHMKLNYFLPSNPYWTRKVALESWGYGWVSTGIFTVVHTRFTRILACAACPIIYRVYRVVRAGQVGRG